MARRRLCDGFTIAIDEPVNLRSDDAASMGLVRDYRGPEIGIETLTDLFINPAGECFHDGTIQPCSYALGDRAERRDAARLRRVAQRAMVDAVEVESGKLLVTDRWSANYYHWMSEVLPRLEAWLAGGAGGLEHEPGGALLLPGQLFERHFVTESLRAYREIDICEAAKGGRNMHAAQLAVVTPVARTGFHHPRLTAKAAGRLRTFFGKAADGGSASRRIHVSRAKANKRRLVNEAAARQVFARHGFETVEFDCMALGEQIALMGETQILAGAHGAGLTNQMFMPAGGAVLDIRQLAGVPNGYLSLAGVSGHGYFYLEATPVDPAMHVHGADLTVDPDRLDGVLEHMADWLSQKEKSPAT